MPEERVFETMTVKAINDRGYKFRVPAYQRGYRWTKEQVTKLLDDLAGWDSTAGYSLQPVIVYQTGQDDDLLDVVDGQQRLTTIGLILGKYTNYALTYETRPETSAFLEELQAGRDRYQKYALQDLFGKNGKLKKSDPERHTIDNYHLLAAYRAIEEWKQQNANRGRLQEVRKTLFEAKLLWYGISENPRLVFARINSGKIQLGNADLIKATLLKDETDRRSLISRQWDEIEQQLADDAFWAFLGQDLSKKYNRVEVLFRLIVPISDQGQSDVGVHTLYNDCIAAYTDGQEGTQFLRLWEDLWILFETLREWYHANPIYHRVGYLSRWRTSKGAKAFDIVEAYGNYSSSTKAEFAHWLDGKVSQILRVGMTNKAGEPPVDAKELMENVLYGETPNRHIEKLLLLFNLPITPGDWPDYESEQGTEADRYRYPFDLHVQEKWSVEHIHAQSPKKPDEAKELDDYLVSVSRMLAEAPKSKDALHGSLSDLRKAVERLIARRKQGVGIEKMRQQIDDVYKGIEETMSDRKDSIDNLALLSGRLNTSIGNDFFFEKRERIREKDRAGEFIPRETRKVFLKYYSNNLSGALWDTEDRRLYMEAIRKKLEPWFTAGEES